MKRTHPRSHPPGYQAVQRFKLNERGRDFIVGDVHGAYDLVWLAMKRVRFNPAADRLFVAGDLVDRGKDSGRALAFLKQPYVHAARGNHEDLWLELYEGGPPGQEVVDVIDKLCNLHAGWWFDMPRAARDELVTEHFARLPFAIEIETPRGKVGIVHADVPHAMDWATFTQRLEGGDLDVQHCALWSRERVRRDDCTGVPGIGRVFVGHCPHVQGVTRRGNVYSVDTGAIFGMNDPDRGNGHLSMANIACKTESLTDFMATPEMQHLLAVFDGDAPNEPFGPVARQRA